MAPGEPVGLAWVELSTGRFVAAGFPAGQLADQLARIAPAECLLAEDAAPLPRAAGRADDGHAAARLGLLAGNGPADAGQALSAPPAWKASASATAPADDQAIRAAGAILDYLAETQKTSLEHIDRLMPYRSSGTLEIDEASRRSLEITRTIREGRREGSLLAVLDRTVTAMGSRLLADWVANPLIDVGGRSARRHEAVDELVADAGAGRRAARDAAAGVRRGAAAGPGDHRPGQPARPELPGPHAPRACRR